MRLWSLHPSYLDAAGLVALWREGLLARKVLSGQTKGYTQHPQIARFRDTSDPVGAIDAYLRAVYDESARRDYRFDAGKIHPPPPSLSRIPVTDGQLDYEFRHLLRKLSRRCPERHATLLRFGLVQPHPLFDVIPGGISPWEKMPPMSRPRRNRRVDRS